MLHKLGEETEKYKESLSFLKSINWQSEQVLFYVTFSGKSNLSSRRDKRMLEPLEYLTTPKEQNKCSKTLNLATHKLPVTAVHHNMPCHEL